MLIQIEEIVRIVSHASVDEAHLFVALCDISLYYTGPYAPDALTCLGRQVV